MIGPLMAFGMLALAPLAFTSVFLVSFCVAIAGLGVIVLLVPNRARAPGRQAAAVPARGRALLLGRRFRALVVAAVAAGPRHHQRRLPLPRAPAPARPRAGCLPAAVRGHARWRSWCWRSRPGGSPTASAAARVFVGGYVLLLAGLRLRCSPRARVSRSRLRARCSSAPPTRRPTACSPRWPRGRSTRRRAGAGSAVLTTATNLARFVASVGFGALWTWAGLNTAVLVCGIALAAAIVVTGVVLRSTREVAHGA